MPYQFRGQSPCPICQRLAAGRLPVLVAGTPWSAAFIPSRQPSLGTVLVVPRRHVLRPGDLEPAEDEDLWRLLSRLVGATLATFAPPSYHVSQYVGAITEEPLDHLFWRLEPRYGPPPADAVRVERLPPVPMAERERQAGLLRQALAGAG
jgi:diadenosine tetraphosphate (Ap4A) HIT family hydrolase